MKAFPTSMNEGYPQIIQGGMDLRDWFAGQAMAHAQLPTHIRQDSWKIDRMDEFPYDQFAKVIYKMADAMMKARENKDE
jgi:hypothetical protein